MKTDSDKLNIRTNMIIRFKADDLSTDRIVTYLGGLVFCTKTAKGAPTVSTIKVSRVTKQGDGVIQCELDDFLNDLQSVVLDRFSFRTEVDVRYQLVKAYYEDGMLKGMVDVSKTDKTGEPIEESKGDKPMSEDKSFPADSPLGRARMIDPTATSSGDRRFIQLKLDTNDVSYVLTQLQALRFKAYHRDLVLPVMQCTKLTDDNETYICETPDKFLDPEHKDAVWPWKTVMGADDLEYAGLIMHIDDGDAKINVTKVGQMTGDEIAWFKCADKPDDIDPSKLVYLPAPHDTLVVHIQHDGNLYLHFAINAVKVMCMEFDSELNKDRSNEYTFNVIDITEVKPGWFRLELNGWVPEDATDTMVMEFGVNYQPAEDVRYRLLQAYFFEKDGDDYEVVDINKLESVIKSTEEDKKPGQVVYNKDTGETTFDEKLRKWGEQRKRQHLLGSNKLGISFILYVKYNSMLSYMVDNVIGLAFQQDDEMFFVSLRSFSKCDEDYVFRAAPESSPNLDRFIECCKTKKFPMQLCGLVFRNDESSQPPTFYYRVNRIDIVYVDFSTPYAGGYQTDRITLSVVPTHKGSCSDSEHMVFRCTGSLDNIIRLYDSPESTSDPKLGLKVADMESDNKLTCQYTLTCEGTSSSHYEVRGVSITEFQGEYIDLKSKRTELFKNINAKFYDDMETVRIPEGFSKLKVCSRLIIHRGVVDTIDIFKGGHVIVEYGATVKQVHVYPGGTLEICEGGQAYDVYACGGSISGGVGSRATFASLHIASLYVPKDVIATIPRGTLVDVATVEGYLFVLEGGDVVDLRLKEGGEVNAFDGIIEKVWVTKGSEFTLYPSGTVYELHEEWGGTVNIYPCAHILKGVFHGIVNVTKSETLNGSNFHDMFVDRDAVIEHTLSESLDELTDEDDEEEDDD